MQLRQLECFRAIMVGGTMTRAAELLGISQPSISNTIAVLEHQLGFTLFERKTGRLKPTPEADLFYEQVQRSLLNIEQLVEYASEIKDKRQGSLTIVAFPGISIHFLPHLLSEFLSDKPSVTVRLISRSSHIIRDLLPYERYDLAINEAPLNQRDSDIKKFKYKCVCAIPAGHRLAEKSTITAKDLDGVPFISLFKDHQTFYHMSNIMAREGVAWNVIAEVQYFASAYEFVSSGIGVSIIDPLISMPQCLGDVVIKPFLPNIPYEISISTPKDNVRSQLTYGFKTFLESKLLIK